MPPTPSRRAESVRAAYDCWAASYDEDPNRTRDLDHEVTRKVLGGLRCRSAVEAGCGTGKNTGFLSRIADRVHAFDFSLRMLDRAREKVASGGPGTSRRVTFAVADLTDGWPAADGSADLAACNLVLEHVEHLPPVFSEAHRVLEPGGRLFVCELHPYRQYLGRRARFERGGATTEIPAFVHHFSDFLEAARTTGFTLERCGEWWHEEDEGKPPRLVSFLFGR